MIKKVSVVILAVLFLLLPVYGMQENKFVFENAEVTKISKSPPYASGLIMTWIEVTVKLEDGEIGTLYEVYLGDKNNPIVGKKYNYWYHFGDFYGQCVGPDIKYIQNIRIVDSREPITTENEK